MKAQIKSLYHEEWYEYIAPTRNGLEKLPAHARDGTQKMMRAGDYLAEHMELAPAILIFCFNPAMMAITDATSIGPRLSVVAQFTRRCKTSC